MPSPIGTPLAISDLPTDEGKRINALINFYFQIRDAYSFMAVWSYYNVIDFTEVPFPSAARVAYDGGWGRPVTIAIGPNSTWLDIWKAMNECIVKSGDHHHIFIETVKWDEAASTISFQCGS